VVTAVVNNATARITVTFSAQPVAPPPTSTVPTITSITPATGRPQGGEQIAINGTNFRPPVRVLFDPGMGATPKEAFVVSVSPTQIVVVTPAVDVGLGQTLATDVIVLTEAGTPTEQRVVKAAGFTFQSAVLTPSIVTVNPATGPSTGGTRITISGSGFQAPVQVTFGGAAGGAGAPLASQVELQVISVNFNQIIAITPEQRLIDPTLIMNSGAIALRVLNINSAKDAVLAGAFRYLPKMQITTVAPTAGPFTGGTRIRIDGIGFDDPLAVVVAGVGAQVISVSGSQVVAITNGVNLTGCSDVTGPIVVTNTNNGDTAQGPAFIFRTPKPLITAVSPNPANIGGTTNITVLNALGFARISVGGVAVNITSSTVNPDGTTTFTVQLPPTLALTTQSCPAGGSAPQPTAFDVVYTSATTGCTDTSPKGITVNPAAVPVLFVNPGAFAPFTATFNAGSPGPPIVPPSETPSATQTVQLVNNGNAPLNITAITTVNGTPGGCSRFSIVAPVIPPTITLNTCEALPISVKFNGPTPPAMGTTDTCTLTISTNAGNKSFLLVGTSQ
jgi:hypothetical protein